MSDYLCCDWWADQREQQQLPAEDWESDIARERAELEWEAKPDYEELMEQYDDNEVADE